MKNGPKWWDTFWIYCTIRCKNFKVSLTILQYIALKVQKLVFHLNIYLTKSINKVKPSFKSFVEELLWKINKIVMWVIWKTFAGKFFFPPILYDILFKGKLVINFTYTRF